MAELLPCPFCGSEAVLHHIKPHKHMLIGVLEYGGRFFVECNKCSCVLSSKTKEEVEIAWNKRFGIYGNEQKEVGVKESKTTCLNCEHLMFSDCYGECSKQLRIVNPNDTCQYAEPRTPKERGGANG